ncbi:hypothetical protein CYMTET_7485 [Cymbomonas tetramitiformis]|uniref:Uncharacterized protein n=1 Tax=Cymbomonas tetramitiformis TaxID=36881 RepID=A0AAE0GUW0_9CHLO|nr:hypothetical protein CYMTET_7485 [Cymbomonas tetramitiformis]
MLSPLYNVLCRNRGDAETKKLVCTASEICGWLGNYQDANKDLILTTGGVRFLLRVLKELVQEFVTRCRRPSFHGASTDPEVDSNLLRHIADALRRLSRSSEKVRSLVREETAKVPERDFVTIDCNRDISYPAKIAVLVLLGAVKCGVPDQPDDTSQNILPQNELIVSLTQGLLDDLQSGQASPESQVLRRFDFVTTLMSATSGQDAVSSLFIEAILWNANVLRELVISIEPLFLKPGGDGTVIQEAPKRELKNALFVIQNVSSREQQWLESLHRTRELKSFIERLQGLLKSDGRHDDLHKQVALIVANSLNQVEDQQKVKVSHLVIDSLLARAEQSVRGKHRTWSVDNTLKKVVMYNFCVLP